MNEKQHGLKTVRIIMVLVIAAVILGFILRGPLFHNEESESVPADGEGTQENIDSDGTEEYSVRAALKTWDVYDLDDLDFVFVIAVLTVDAPAEETVTLDHFYTDEGISLDSVQPYVRSLEEHSYFLGRRNVMFSLVSAKEHYDAPVFIPVKDRTRKQIVLASGLEGIEDMTIRLDRNILKDGSSLYLSHGEGEVISDEETYSLSVCAALDITDEMFFFEDADGNRMEYAVPAADRVYAFEIEAQALAGDSVVITDAEFIPEGYSSGYHAMDGAIRSMKETNMIGRSIVTEDRGFLFFEVYGPEYSPVTYRGVLLLYLENKDEPLSIQVNLN